MTSQDGRPEGDEPQAEREPFFQLPVVLIVLVAALVAVQIVLDLLNSYGDDLVLALFAFIPNRYLLEHGEPVYPGGWGALAWTFLTHAFLHAGWVHLGFNAAMLMAIGRMLLARLGTLRFLALLAVSAVMGAAMHLVVDWGSGSPMLGASGAVSGLMGGLLRFLRMRPDGGPARIGDALADSRVRGFIFALVLMNVVLVVFGTAPFGGSSGGGVAWAAHLGGFLAGFLGIDLFWKRQERSFF